MSMFGGRDKKQRLLDEHSEDRSMAFSGADDYERLENFLDHLRDEGVDISDMSLEAINRLMRDKD